MYSSDFMTMKFRSAFMSVMYGKIFMVVSSVWEILHIYDNVPMIEICCVLVWKFLYDSMAVSL